MKPRHLVGVLAVALTASALTAPLARADTPIAKYAQFAGCPSQKEDPSVFFCVRTVIKSGHFQMGSKDVPITNPLVMIGGVSETFEGPIAANASGGLKPAKQLVPGGVVGLTGLDWLVNFLGIEQLKLYAVTELVGAPVLGPESLSLPLRVHLINPALGNNCYVGSTSSPISLNMIEGTTAPPPPNKPITGKVPTFSIDGAAGVLRFSNGTFVDNSFAAPGASGCTLTLFGVIPFSLNGLVNIQAGLPAPAGTNETVQNFDVEAAPAGAVYPAS